MLEICGRLVGWLVGLVLFYRFSVSFYFLLTWVVFFIATDYCRVDGFSWYFRYVSYVFSSFLFLFFSVGFFFFFCQKECDICSRCQSQPLNLSTLNTFPATPTIPMRALITYSHRRKPFLLFLLFLPVVIFSICKNHYFVSHIAPILYTFMLRICSHILNQILFRTPIKQTIHQQ